MKNRILVGLLVCMMLSPVFAEGESRFVEYSANPVETTTSVIPGSVLPSDSIPSEQVSILKSAPVSKLPFKQPVSKRKIAMKFICAMCGVAFSSLALFLILTVYNKLRTTVIKTSTTDYSNTLNMPNNLKDAINIFLEKTKQD